MTREVVGLGSCKKFLWVDDTTGSVYVNNRDVGVGITAKVAFSTTLVGTDALFMACRKDVSDFHGIMDAFVGRVRPFELVNAGSGSE